MSDTATNGLGLERIFPGQSAMAAHMRTFDWSTTDLGAPTTWPPNLRVALGICLTAQLPMQIWWGSARVLFYNDACITLFGATNLHPLALGRTGREAWAALDNHIGSQIEQVFATGAANGPVDSRSIFNKDHPQRAMDVSFSFSPLLGESGAVEGVFVICRETTAMRASEEKLSAFVNATSDIVYEMSADWREMRYLKGKAFIATTENPRSDWTETYIPREEKPRVWATIQQALATQGHFELEHRVIRLDGTVGWTFSRAIPLLDERGEIVKWFGAASDITERKMAEAQQKYLLKLSDALRPLADAVAIQATVTETVLDYFDADRCYYCEVENGNAIIRRDASRGALPSVVGVYPLENLPFFNAAMTTGRPLIVEDAHVTALMDQALQQLCLQMQIISFINIPVIKDEKYAGNLCITQCTPRTWTKIEIALAEEIAQRTWATVERARTEAALRTSEEKYRTLFNSIDEGFCIVEVILDENGKPYDLLHLETNQAYELYTGLSGMAGKRSREIIPEGGPWLDFYGNVALTGQAARNESYLVAPIDRWIAASASRIGGEGSLKVAIVFDDVTERKHREANLAFLAEVSADFAPLASAEELMQRVGVRLARYLNLSRCDFSMVEEEADRITTIYDWRVNDELPSVLGEHQISTFLSAAGRQQYRVGQMAVVNDIRHDPLISAPPELMAQLGIGAVVDAPYLEEGRWKFLLSACRSQASVWRAHEIELLRELTARIYIRLERARAEEALRASEAKYRTIFETIEEGFHVTELIYNEAGEAIDYRFLEVNQVFERLTGLKNVTGQLGSEIAPKTEAYWIKNYDRVVRTGEPLRLENYNEDTRRWYAAYVSRVPGTRSQVAIAFDDITERKRREQQQELLLKLADTLRPLQDPLAIQEAAMTVLGSFMHVNRAFYTEISPNGDTATSRVEYLSGAPSIVGQIKISAFDSDWLTRYLVGETVVVNNVDEDLKLTEADRAALRSMQFCAGIGFPLRKGGRLLGIVTVHQATPRTWTADEIAFLEEVTERMWAAVERARAEAALRASEARIRIAIEAAQLATWEWHLRTGEIFWNEQHFLLFGMTPRPSPLATADFFSHVHPADRTWLGATLQASIDERRVFQAEFRAIKEDGTQRWMSGYGRVVAEENGKVTQMSGVMFDITEHKEAEDALRESEARQAIILETMAEGVVTIDRDGHFFSANAAAERILGVARSELIGQSINAPPYQRFDLDGTPWGDRPVLAEVAAAGQHIFQHDYVIERRDGSRVVVSRNITAMRTTAGALLGFVSTLSDITEQKRAETALRDSEERFRAVANLVPDLLWSNDPAGVTEWHNQRWLEYNGQILENVAAHGWLAAVHPEDRALALHNFQRALAQGEPLRQEERIRSVTGEYRWFLVQANPLKDATGKILRWFGAATDIHEQRMARETLEQRVQERTQELEALSVSRQQLLERVITAQEDERRRIAHELHDTFGQFLSALNLRLSLLQQSIQPHAGAVLPVVAELEQLWQLVNEIDSELRRLTSELRPPILDDLGLEEAIRRYAEAWSQTTAIPVDVYSAGFAGERLAPTLELTIYRIVQEALTNVLKHAQAAAVSVILERRPKELQLIIEDNGVGFESNAIDSQVAGRRPLGLIGIQERVALVGGRVDLETAPGVGTTIYVHTPLMPNKQKENG